MRKHHHTEATAGAIYLCRCRAAGVEPALGLAYDLAPLNRGVLLLVGETANGRVCWVERAGMALDIRDDATVVHYDVPAFRAGLELRRPPVALDWRVVRALWVENNDDPGEAQTAFDHLLRQ
jgi:hypothetical protein